MTINARPTRRNFLLGCGAVSATGFAALGQARTVTAPLPIIPLHDFTSQGQANMAFALRRGQHDFGTGALSDTFGINGSYLGPVVRVKQGQSLLADINNGLDEVATIHWHGLHISGDVDGGPHEEIEPGESWRPEVPITQQASMNWYHAHTHGRTARQTYMGLAGLLLVEDDASLSADMPRTYGVDDFTIVLQDKSFDEDGRLQYAVSAEIFEDGFTGEQLVINGFAGLAQQVTPRGLVRLRLLNASNARNMRLSLNSGPVTVIASDGGFLPAPIEAEDLFMSPGERYEILVDTTTVENQTLQVKFDDWRSNFLWGALSPGPQPVLDLIRGSETGFTGRIPRSLANLSSADRGSATRARRFILNMDDQESLALLAAGAIFVEAAAWASTDAR